MGTTVVVITHNQVLRDMADRVITVKSGEVKEMYLNENPVDVEMLEW
jgi:putative ABC transport system ATP-binding protein